MEVKINFIKGISLSILTSVIMFIVAKTFDIAVFALLTFYLLGLYTTLQFIIQNISHFF